MDANGPLLSALAEQAGLHVVDQTCLPDMRETIADWLAASLLDADLILLSGGVSVGDFDHVSGALADAGLRTHFSRVALKPGKPVTFASSQGRMAFGLPGNPVAVYLTFHLFVLRAAAGMLGVEDQVVYEQRRLRSRFGRRKAERTAYVPCRLVEGDVEPVDYHGSAHLMALSGSDGFFVVPEGENELEAGHRVRFLPVPRA
jgi:molybdopterin molybdotransferase